jgi:hypothetical protein
MPNTQAHCTRKKIPQRVEYVNLLQTIDMRILKRGIINGNSKSNMAESILSMSVYGKVCSAIFRLTDHHTAGMVMGVINNY